MRGGRTLLLFRREQRSGESGKDTEETSLIYVDRHVNIAMRRGETRQVADDEVVREAGEAGETGRQVHIFQR